MRKALFFGLVFGAIDQHGAMRQGKHLGGHATQQQALKTATTMATDKNHVAVVINRGLNNAICDIEV